jgi:hypothetical protein
MKLLINLSAGPGSGKSTGSCYVFAMLKMQGINAEYAPEYAKMKVWSNDTSVFENQFYVTGKQSYYISRLKDVDIVITDSPIWMGALYAKEEPYGEIYQKFLVKLNNTYTQKNYFIERVKEYNPAGRFQDEAGAKKVDKEILDFMETHNIEYKKITGNQKGYDEIVKDIIDYLG